MNKKCYFIYIRFIHYAQNRKENIMKKVDTLQKCVIVNKIQQLINKDDFRAGEKVTIVIETKRTGELKSLTLEKGE